MLEQFTLGDLADIEDVTGMALTAATLDSPPMKFALALYWIVQRKSNPKMTYEDARNTPVSELSAFQKAFAGNPTEALPAEAGEAESPSGEQVSPITAEQD